MNALTLKSTLETLKTAYGPDLFAEALALLASKSTPLAATPAAAAPVAEAPEAPKKSKSKSSGKSKKVAAAADPPVNKHLVFDEAGNEVAPPAPAEKPKKAPSGWALFCQRVGETLRAAEIKLGEPLSVASHVAVGAGVKESKAYDSVTAEQILEFAKTYVPVKKEPKAGKKAAAAPAEPPPVAAEEPEAPVAAAAPKRKGWSEDAKKAAAAKRAAKKAATAAAAEPAAAAGGGAAQPVAEEDDEILFLEGESYRVKSNGAAYRMDGLNSFAGIFADGVLDLTAEEPA
jgi:hypothetical protein